MGDHSKDFLCFDAVGGGGGRQ